jgi:cell division septation protein DedD
MDAILWVSALALALALAGCSSESTDWKSATSADTSEAFQQYLQQHPNGANAEQARVHLKQLQEDRDWQSASSADNRAAYEQFLAQHADGKWAEEARIRIENFAQGGGPAAPAGASAAASASAAAAPAAPAASPAPAAPAAKPTASARSAPANRVASAAKSAHAAAPTHAHLVQLGAFSSQARAESEWKALQSKFPAQLKSMQPRYVPARTKSSHLVRLQVSVSSAASARGLCAALHKHSQACVPVTA